MLTPEQVEGLQVAFEQLAEPITQFLLQDVARRVSEAGQLTSTASYQIWRLQELGKSLTEVEAEVSRILNQQADEARRLFTQAAQVGYNFDLDRLHPEGIPFQENSSIQQMVDAAVALADEKLRNLTQTIGFVAPDGIDYDLTQAYLKTTDYAFTQVFTGAADYNTAIRQACAKLSSQGIRSIDYESGIHTSLEAAIRRDMMGGLGLMTEQISRKNHDDLGADGWEISAHAASAPDHEPIQGKQYSDKKYEALNNSLHRRIGTLNCGHNAFPVILGVNAPQYTQAELNKFRGDNAKGVDYEGKHFDTVYDATQYQRRIERSIRAQKRRVLIADNQPNMEAIQQAKIRLNVIRAEYARFCKSTGLRSEEERLWVSGFERKSRTKHILQTFSNGQKSQEFFDLEAVKDSFLKTLDQLDNPGDNIEVLRYYTQATDYVKDKKMPGPIGYDFKNDIIRYNSEIPLPEGVRPDGIFLHELAHRADFLLYNASENEEWQKAIQDVKSTIEDRRVEILKWFEDDGKYAEDGFFSDIISALSEGIWVLPFSHSRSYWQGNLNTEREIFANINVIDIFHTPGYPELEKLLKPIYSVFKTIIKEGGIN